MLLKVRSSLISATEDRATKDKAEQGATLRQPGKTRWASSDLKNTPFRLLTHWSYYSLALSHRWITHTSCVSLPEVLGVVNDDGHLDGIAASTLLVIQGYFAMLLLLVGILCNGERGAIERTNKTQSLKMFNTLRPRQNGRHFPDDIFKCIFLYENV